MQAILKRLKEKAFLVLSQYRSNIPIDAPPINISIFDSQADGIDELALFGGQTRVLMTKTLSQKSAGHQMTSNPTGSTTNHPSTSTRASPPSTLGLENDVFPEIHPSLMQYMSLLPNGTPAASFPGHSNSDPQSEEQVAVNGFAPAAYNAQLPGDHLRNEMNTFTGSSSSMDNPNSFDLLQQFYQNAPVTTIDTWGSNDLTDLGQMMNIDNGMDDEWMSFMKESGIVN